MVMSSLLVVWPPLHIRSILDFTARLCHYSGISLVLFRLSSVHVLIFFWKSSKVELFLHFSIIFENFSLIIKFAKLFRKLASRIFEIQVHCRTRVSKNWIAIGGNLMWKRLKFLLWVCVFFHMDYFSTLAWNLIFFTETWAS